MLTLSPAELIVLVTVLPVLGAIAGYGIAVAKARQEAGGVSAAELRREFDAYRATVDQHFSTTGGLLYELTSHYQKICAHMAEGARDLGAHESAEIAQLRSALLPLASQAGSEDAQPGATHVPYRIDEATGKLEPPKDYVTLEADAEKDKSSLVKAG